VLHSLEGYVEVVGCDGSGLLWFFEVAVRFLSKVCARFTCL
jgi:hypothetical protein